MFVTVLAALLAGVLIPAMSHADAWNDDVREQCRIAVSGAFIDLHNAIDIRKDSLESWNSKRRQLRQRRAELEEGVTRLQQKLRHSPFDRSQEEKLTGLEAALQAVTAQLEQRRVVSTRNQKELSRLRKRLGQWKPQVLRLFRLEYPDKLKNSGGYRFTLAYRQGCDRFRYICPLTAAGRRQLSKINKLIGSMPACERYAQVLPPD
jgi:hypothetical protein